MKKPVDLSPRQWLGQVAFYVMTVVLIGYFADGPPWQVVARDVAELKLVVRYSGKLLGECRQLGGQELEKLAPNMRAPMVCPREKSPLFVEMSIDGEVVYEQTVTPSGLHDDGILALYKRFAYDAGPANLRVRIRDDTREDDFSHILQRSVELDPDRILVVEFNDSGFKIIQSPGEPAATS